VLEVSARARSREWRWSTRRRRVRGGRGWSLFVHDRRGPHVGELGRDGLGL